MKASDMSGGYRRIKERRKLTELYREAKSQSLGGYILHTSLITTGALFAAEIVWVLMRSDVNGECLFSKQFVIINLLKAATYRVLPGTLSN